MDNWCARINTVEDLVLYKISDNKTFRDIELEIALLDDTNRFKMQQLLTYVKERSKAPLSIGLKFLCFLFPFGLMNKFYSNKLLDPLGVYKQGFIQKFRDYNLYSILGILGYMIILFLITDKLRDSLLAVFVA